MAAIKMNDFRKWLNTAESEMVKHMRATVQERGRQLTEVSEVLIYHFTYKGVLNGEWMTQKPVPIAFYELSFDDKTFISQFWHRTEDAPLTYQQVREMLKIEQLIPQDRKFIEEFARNNQFRGFAEKLFDELLQIGMDIDVGDDWKARWKHRIAQRAWDLANHTLMNSEHVGSCTADL